MLMLFLRRSLKPRGGHFENMKGPSPAPAAPACPPPGLTPQPMARSGGIWYLQEGRGVGGDGGLLEPSEHTLTMRLLQLDALLSQRLGEAGLATNRLVVI